MTISSRCLFWLSLENWGGSECLARPSFSGVSTEFLKQTAARQRAKDSLPTYSSRERRKEAAGSHGSVSQTPFSMGRQLRFLSRVAHTHVEKAARSSWPRRLESGAWFLCQTQCTVTDLFLHSAIFSRLIVAQILPPLTLSVFSIKIVENWDALAWIRVSSTGPKRSLLVLVLIKNDQNLIPVVA